MNGYGLDFWMLKRIQADTGLPNEEIRRRNLALSVLEREILIDVPIDGPCKHADVVKATTTHHRVNRALPASLILKTQESTGFSEWISKIHEADGRYKAVKMHLMSLEI